MIYAIDGCTNPLLHASMENTPATALIDAVYA